MSFSIKKAMGWGMTWEAFQALTLIKDSEDLLESLYDAFDVDPSVLIIDKATVSDSFKTPNVAAIIENNLLSTTFTRFSDDEPTYGPGTNLFFTDGYDRIGNIGFFPNLYYREKWYRRDDSLDYEFERWRDGTARHQIADPRNISEFVGYGFHPWTNYMMNLNGAPYPMYTTHTFIEESNAVPFVPLEIRWYLKKLNILNDTGINCLRPLISQWWS